MSLKKEKHTLQDALKEMIKAVPDDDKQFIGFCDFSSTNVDNTLSELHFGLPTVEYNFNAVSTTIDDMAQTLGTLIEDLKTKGIIG